MSFTGPRKLRIEWKKRLIPRPMIVKMPVKVFKVLKYSILKISHNKICINKWGFEWQWIC